MTPHGCPGLPTDESSAAPDVAGSSRQGAWALAVTAYVAFVAVVARLRPVDADEGFYAMAAALCSRGLVPYTDFFFPQAPATPFVYAPFSWWDSSILSLRILSAALTVATVAIWALALLRGAPGRAVALPAIALLAVNPYLLGWGVVVKTYALANLAISVAILALHAALRPRRAHWAWVAGLSLALAVGTRLLYLPVAGAIVGLWLLEAQARSPTRLLALIGGFALGALPLAPLLAQSPEAVVFNNVGYHELRAEAPPLAGRALHLARLVFAKLLLRPYLLILVALVAYGWRSPGPLDRLVRRLSLGGALVLTVVSLIPFPVYPQYFTATLGVLLLPGAAAGVQRLQASRTSATRVGWLATLTMLVALMELPREALRNSPWATWSPGAVAAVGRAIREKTSAHATVLALWPGYALEAARRPVPGLENHFALRVAHKVPLPARKRLHLANASDVVRAAGDPQVGAVVLGGWTKDFETTSSAADQLRLHSLLEREYRPPTVVGGTEIYTRR